MLVIIMGVFGLVIFGFQIKNFFDKSKVLKQALAKQKYNKLMTGKLQLIAYTLFFIFGVFSIFYRFYINDQTGIALGIISSIMSLGEFLNYQIKYTFYYNDQDFIVNGMIVRYRSIKTLHQKNRRIVVFTTLDNQTEMVSNDGYNIIGQYTKVKLT